jgi:hypothetical protein
LVGGVVVAAVVVAILLVDSDDPAPAPRGETGPEQGIACPFLQAAFDEFEAGNEAAFAAAVKIAAREAELTLERSGQVFGRPEELALELRAELARSQSQFNNGISRLVAEAEGACQAT